MKELRKLFEEFTKNHICYTRDCRQYMDFHTSCLHKSLIYVLNVSLFQSLFQAVSLHFLHFVVLIPISNSV